MAETKEAATPVEYTPEELAVIKELTQFFNRAPGQVDIPSEAEEVAPEPIAPSGEELTEAELAPEPFLEDSTAPAAPKVDFNKFKELTELEDLDTLASPQDFSLEEQEEPAEKEEFAEIPPAPSFELKTPSVSEDLTTELEAPQEEFTAPDFDLETPSATEEFTTPQEEFTAPDFGLETPTATEEFTAPKEEFTTTDFDLETPSATEEFTAPKEEFTTTDFGIETPSDTLSFETSSLPTPPSLEELQPEVVLSQPTSLGDLTSELSSLAQEQVPELFTDNELRELRRILKTYPSEVRQAVIEAVLEDKISSSEARELVSAILDGKEPQEIATILSAKLNRPIEAKKEGKKIRTIFTRPSYTATGMRRQAELLKYTKYATIATIILIFTTISGWYFLLKPWLYRKIVEEGRNIILYSQDSEAIKRAEAKFQDALSYYPYDYHAFLQYADAYKKRGKYEDAFRKLFGHLQFIPTEKAQRLADSEIFSVEQIWPLLQKVPVVKYEDEPKRIISINGVKLLLQELGAFTISQLHKKREDARVLLALGQFHANPARRFRQSPYRNNLLAIDYFRRILTFKVDTPTFQADKYAALATHSIGMVYYHQKDYYRALDYFEKIIQKDPYNVAGQTGVLQALLKIYRQTNDPRLVIQQHSIVKHTLKIEEKLPMFILARLAAFYIDLPGKDDIRIRYNVSPVDTISGEPLKDRAYSLLEILFKAKETDIYGETRKGDTFAEGYYQRGRYYRLEEKQLRMAMKQMEYAYNYDRRHFLAINDRAEMLIELNDFAGAIELLKLAYEQITPENLELIGDLPEDETLLEADTGIVPFNLGKAMYFGLLQDLGPTHSWSRISQVDRYESVEDFGKVGFFSQLDKIETYFEEALQRGISRPEVRAELQYYLGWTNYARGNYKKALSYWEQIPVELQRQFKNIDLAKSHGLYKAALADSKSRTAYLDAALGYLTFLRDKYTKIAANIRKPMPENKLHRQLFTRLSIIENNLGAIYELKNQEKEALLHYYQSLNYSKQISEENETAQLNIKLAFKRTGLEEKEAYPLIMDFVPPFIEEDPQL